MFYANSWGRIFGKKIEEKCTQPGNLATSSQLINISRQNNSTRFRPEFSTTQILTGTIISQGRTFCHKILIFLFWWIFYLTWNLYVKMETEIHPTPLFKNLYFNFYELLIELILSEWSLKIPWKFPIDFFNKIYILTVGHC